MKRLFLLSLLLLFNSCSSCKKNDFSKIIDFRMSYKTPCSDCTKIIFNKKKLYVSGITLLDKSHIAKAWKKKNIFGSYDIFLDLTKKGGQILQRATRDNIGKRMAVFINGDIIMAPTIMEEIKWGKVTITGVKTERKVDNILHQLKVK